MRNIGGFGSKAMALVFLAVFAATLRCEAGDLNYSKIEELRRNLLSMTAIKEKYPLYVPVPDELKYRIEVYKTLSYWTVMSVFPFGRDQQNYVTGEGIKSVVLKACDVDGTATVPISCGRDLIIFFDQEGRVERLKGHSNIGVVGAGFYKHLGFIEFHSSADSMLVAAGEYPLNDYTKPKVLLEIKLTANVGDTYTLSVLENGNTRLYTFDGYGRVLSYSIVGLETREWGFDTTTGRLSDSRILNSTYGKGGSVERKYSFSWDEHSPTGGAEVSCKATGLDKTYCSKYDSQPYVFSYTQEGTHLTQKQSWKNLGTGVVYRTATGEYLCDSTGRLQYYKETFWDGDGKINTRNYNFEFDGDIAQAIVLTVGNPGVPPILETIFELKGGKNLSLTVSLPLTLFSGKHDIKFSKNGRLPRILNMFGSSYNIKQVYEVYSLEYYD